jgi:tRNA pseudouridine38-40 synthase
MPRTLKIVLAYDGSAFVGWQRQPAGASVQGHLEAALAAIEGGPVAVVGAGRTDAGVHALGQVASCRLSHPLPVATIARALNARLPEAVRVLSVEEAPADFHARYSAKAKTYRYLISTDPILSPFHRRYVWALPQPLDVPAMAAGIRALEGEHDFAALQGAGSASKTTVRTIHAAAVRTTTPAEVFGQAFVTPGDRPSAGPLVVVEMTGNGFLRHMVRNGVGSLVEIGEGRRDPSWMAGVLASGDRAQAGPTAPAEGLFLVEVRYEPVLAPPPASL